MEMKCLTLSIGKNHPVLTLTQECLRALMALTLTPMEWVENYLVLMPVMEQQTIILDHILQVEFQAYILEDLSPEEALQKKASLNLVAKFRLVLLRSHLWSLGTAPTGTGREFLQLILDSGVKTVCVSNWI